MVVNQMFSQTVLTITCSLQCPALKIFLNISFRPLSFFQHTSYVSHIRQPIKMWLSISYAESVGLYGPLNMTAKRKRLWIRSFNCYQLPIEFDRFSSADLPRISIRRSAGQSFICGTLI